jgi:hypothetical protein
VNDIVVIYSANREVDVDRLINKLYQRFELRDMRRLTFFLSVRVIQDGNNIYLCQNSYMNKLAIEYQMNTTKFPTSSLPIDFIDASSYASRSPSEVDHALRKKYRKKVGSICYSTNITRPDVTKAAFKLAEYLINPEPDHLHATNHCLQYLHAIKHLVIRYSPSRNGELTVLTPSNINLDPEEEEEKHVFENTVDASFANSPERRSYEDFIFKLYEGMIDWASRKQAIVFIFIIEAELLALLHAGKACIWWINFFNKLDFDYDHQVRIFNDNQQIIRILTSEQPKITIKLLHVDVAQCWLRQSVQLGHLNVSYLQTNQMTADGLIKQLLSQKHRSFVEMLGLVDVGKLI